MHRCQFPGCKTGLRKIKGGKNQAVNSTSCFKFPPKGSENYNLWVRYVGKNLDKVKDPHLCEDHFMPSDVVHHGKRASLVKNAIPCRDFDPSKQSLTIFTPTKGEFFMDYFPK